MNNYLEKDNKIVEMDIPDEMKKMILKRESDETVETDDSIIKKYFGQIEVIFPKRLGYTPGYLRFLEEGGILCSGFRMYSYRITLKTKDVELPFDLEKSSFVVQNGGLYIKINVPKENQKDIDKLNIEPSSWIKLVRLFFDVSYNFVTGMTSPSDMNEIMKGTKK